MIKYGNVVQMHAVNVTCTVWRVRVLIHKLAVVSSINNCYDAVWTFSIVVFFQPQVYFICNFGRVAWEDIHDGCFSLSILP